MRSQVKAAPRATMWQASKHEKESTATSGAAPSPIAGQDNAKKVASPDQKVAKYKEIQRTLKSHPDNIDYHTARHLGGCMPHVKAQ